jgi:hypothetical protein
MSGIKMGTYISTRVRAYPNPRPRFRTLYILYRVLNRGWRGGHDIYPWFIEIYHRGDPDIDLLYIDNIFDTFKSYDIYYIMSKEEQRELTARCFLESI